MPLRWSTISFMVTPRGPRTSLKLKHSTAHGNSVETAATLTFLLVSQPHALKRSERGTRTFCWASPQRCPSGSPAEPESRPAAAAGPSPSPERAYDSQTEHNTHTHTHTSGVRRHPIMNNSETVITLTRVYNNDTWCDRSIHTGLLD